MEISLMMDQLKKNITRLLAYRQPNSPKNDIVANLNKGFDAILEKFVSIQSEFEKIKAMPEKIQEIVNTQAEMKKVVAEIDSYLDRVSEDEDREDVLKIVEKMRANRESFIKLDAEMSLILNQLGRAKEVFSSTVETPLKTISDAIEQFEKKTPPTKQDSAKDIPSPPPEWVLILLVPLITPLILLFRTCLTLIETATKAFATVCVSLFKQAQTLIGQAVSLISETRQLFSLLDDLLPSPSSVFRV